MKKYLLALDAQLLKEVKMLVAKRGTTVAQLIRDLLRKEVSTK